MSLDIPGLTRLSARNPGPMTGLGNWTYLVDGSVPTLIDAGIGASEHLDEVSSSLDGAGPGLSRSDRDSRAHRPRKRCASAGGAMAGGRLPEVPLARARCEVSGAVAAGGGWPAHRGRRRRAGGCAHARPFAGSSVSLACGDAHALQRRPSRRGVYGRDSWFSRRQPHGLPPVAGAHRGDGAGDGAAGTWRHDRGSRCAHRALPRAPCRARGANPRGAPERGRYGDGDCRQGVR